MKSWSSVILVTASLAVSLVLWEIGVRLTFADRIVLFPRYHEETTYGEFKIRRLKPQTTFWPTSVDGSWRFTMNGQGFRDHRDYSYDRNGIALRIIGLGDSHTQGFEVRQDRTYVAVIEHYLNSRGLDSEAINAGVSGFSTAEEAVFLEHEALKYNPDVVVLGFYANDFEDNLRSDLFRLRGEELVVHQRTHAPGSLLFRLHNSVAPLRWLSENSYLYSVAMNTV
jgi:hypothetical protein